MYGTKFVSRPISSAVSDSRARRCRSKSRYRFAALEIDFLTDACATVFARVIVSPTAMPITSRMTSAVSPKSFSTNGKRGRSTLPSFGRGAVSTIVVDELLNVSADTSVIPRHRGVRFLDLVRVRRLQVVARVEHQREGLQTGAGDVNVLLHLAALFVPRHDAILARRHIGDREVRTGVRERVPGGGHHVDDRGHVRVHVAVDVHDSGGVELVRFAGAFAIEAEV